MNRAWRDQWQAACAEAQASSDRLVIDRGYIPGSTDSDWTRERRVRGALLEAMSGGVLRGPCAHLGLESPRPCVWAMCLPDYIRCVPCHLAAGRNLIAGTDEDWTCDLCRRFVGVGGALWHHQITSADSVLILTAAVCDRC